MEAVASRVEAITTSSNELLVTSSKCIATDDMIGTRCARHTMHFRMGLNLDILQLLFKPLDELNDALGHAKGGR